MSKRTPMVQVASSRLTEEQFQQLHAMPAAAEWFANISNPQTRRAYQLNIADFCSFFGIQEPAQFQSVTRGHVLAWRTQMEQRRLAGSTQRRKLSALASLYDYLLNAHAISGGNPVHSVKRPVLETHEGKTPGLSDQQASALLGAPDPRPLKGKRDRAILAVLLYHGLRREEAARLQRDDVQEQRGIEHLRVHGKGGKPRYLPLHPVAAERITAYWNALPETDEQGGALFRSLRGPTTGEGVSVDGLYALVTQYAKAARIKVAGLGVHGLRVTASTNALENDAEIAKVQAWLGHANISTTKIYDRREAKTESSPTFEVRY